MKGCENEGLFTHPMGACWTDRERVAFVVACIVLQAAQLLWRYFRAKT